MNYLSAAEAGAAFPRPITAETVRHRMKIGIRGVKLRHIWDGKSYHTTKEWIEQFLRELNQDSRISFETREHLIERLIAKYGWRTDATQSPVHGTDSAL